MEFFRKHHIAFHVFAFAVTSLIAITTFLGGIFASAGLSPSLADVLGHVTATPATVMSYTNGSTDNGDFFPNSVGFNVPLSTAVDTVNHRLFVSDAANNRVLVFNLNSSNIPLDLTADKVLGQADFTSQNSGTTASTMSAPYGLAYDAVHNRLFVANEANWRVLVFDTTTIVNGEDAIYVLGQPDFTTFTGVIDQTATHDPYGVLYDPINEYLFVSQYNGNRVSVFDVDPATISNGSNAIHLFGQPNFTTFSGAVTINKLDRPYGMAYNSSANRLFVSDTYNNRIVVYDTTTMTDGTPLIGPDALYVIGQSNFTSETSGTSTTKFDTPTGLALDTSNNILYVTDTANNRILTFDVTSDNATTATHVLGQADFVTGTSGTTVAKLKNPIDISIDDQGHMYVADTQNNRVIIYDSITAITNGQDAVGGLGHTTSSYTFGSTSNFTESGANSNADTYVNPYGFENPYGIAMDETGHRLFVSDYTNNRVLVFNLSNTNAINDYQADYVLGQSTFYSNSSGTSSTTLSGPQGIAYDTSNQLLYVADSSNNRVVVYNVASITNGESAVNVLGQADLSSSSSGTTSATLNSPSYVAYDATNSRLFVSDTANGRVLVYDTTILTNGEAAVNVLGQADFTTGTSTLSQSKMMFPCGIALDPSGNRLFVVEGLNSHRVLAFDVTPATIANGANAIGLLGQANYGVGVTGTTASTFNYPSPAVYDTSSNILFVGDSANHRVLAFDVATLTNGESAIGVFGQDDFTSSGTSVDQYGTSGPDGLYFDVTNRRLFVSSADDTTHRVGQFNLVSLPSQSFSSGTVGASYSQSITTTQSQGTVSFELVSGTLPTGLTLGSSSISGTPTTAGTYNFTIRAKDTIGGSIFYSNQRSFAVTISAPSGGGGGGGPAWCQDVTANNYGGTLPCMYGPADLCPNISGVQATMPNGMILDSSGNCITPSGPYCFDSQASNYGDPLPCTYDQSQTCQDPLANNIGGTLPCTYTTIQTVCTDVLASNYGNPLPCTYVPPPATCQDPSASNFGSVGTCLYPPPIVTTCQDPLANNVGGTLPCTYTTTQTVCTDVTANNYGGTLPCTYPPQEPTCATDPSLCPVVVTPPSPPETTGTGGCVLDAPPGSSIGTIVTTQITGTLCETRSIIVRTGGRIVDVYNSPFGDVLSKTISATGLIVGTIVTLSTLLFATPLSFSEIILIPQRLWSLLLIAFGLKKRIRPWGTVYDSVTKQPLDPAYVVLYDKDGKEVASSITDLDGRYGFLVGPGIYRMTAQKTNYVFPSLVLSRHTRDEIYLELYFGNYFEVKDDTSLIARNIPMDPEKFDWNEFVKREQKLMKFYSKRDLILTKIADVFFGIGFIFSLIALIVSPVIYNIAIFILYLIMHAIKETGLRPKKLGTVVDQGGNPLSFGLIHIYSKSLDTKLMTKVLDKKGHYFALAPKGTYYAVIERKNPDGSYTKLFTSPAFEVDNGVINLQFKV